MNRITTAGDAREKSPAVSLEKLKRINKMLAQHLLKFFQSIKRKPSEKFFQIIILLIPTLILAGYEISAIFADIFSTETSIASITFRVISIAFVFAAILHVLLHSKANDKKLSLSLAVVFFALYSLRILFSEDLERPVHFYLMWTWGAALVSFFLGWFNGPMSSRQLFILTAFLTAASAYILYTGGTYILDIDGNLANVSRLALPRLNPSSVSFLGSLCILISSALIISFKRNTPNILFLLPISCTFFGCDLVYYGGSKAVFIAIAAALSFYLFKLASNALNTRLIIQLSLVPLIFLSNFFDKSTHVTSGNIESDGQTGVITGIFTRLSDIEAAGGSTSGRLLALQDSLRLFIEHPFFGSSIEVPFWRFSPHNLIVESIIGLGLLGSIPFFLLLFVAFKNTVFIRLTNAHDNATGALLILVFVVSLLTGSIWNSTAFWFCLGLAVNKHATDRKFFS